MANFSNSKKRSRGRRSMVARREDLIEDSLPDRPDDDDALTLEEFGAAFRFTRRHFVERKFKRWVDGGYIPGRYIMVISQRRRLIKRRGLRYCQAYLAGEGIEI